MGVARRRKLVGTYSTGGRVEDFVTPVGTVAITWDVVGVAPSTVMFDAGTIVEIEPRPGG